MFYLIYGKDTYRSREKLNELLNHFKTKVSELGFFRIDGESFSGQEFEELLKARTLFEKKYVVVCDRVMENKPAADFVIGKIEQCAESENIFLFWEEDLDDEILENLKKRAAKVQIFEPLSGVKLRAWFGEKKISAQVAEKIIAQCGSDLWRAAKEIEKYQLGSEASKLEKAFDYNPFAICDAFAEKNKAKAWILYQQAQMAGVEAEEVFYKILWQIKNLLMVKKLLAADAKDIAKESGLKPFPAEKAAKAAKNFTEEELENYSYEMLRIYHEERRGESELPIEFEKFLVS
ncbi:MAG: hypothetical protein L6Q29_02470 [Candidatus Pacebacteria bacterium]|nr:hypothetical protein [Candidatus Paceibacterota bacterium]NUQ57425.1 hypothetical protein [Candidatus Paceibacter sp.]